MMSEPTDEPGPSRVQTSARLSPASVDESEKSQRLSVRKARKLSRVFADFSLLDPFGATKRSDDLRALRSKRKSTPPRPATAHGNNPRTSLRAPSTHSLDENLPRPTSPTTSLPPSITPITTLNEPSSKQSKSSNDNTSPSPIRPNAPLTPQINPSVPPSPENIPLPPSRPSSSRSSILLKKRRPSLDERQLDEKLNSKAPLSIRSRSLRITPISEMSPGRPTTPKAPTAKPDLSLDTRDPPAPPEAARQHYVEVKRARKMTQLFGDELPQELFRMLDDRRKPEYIRRRADSTGSSILDSVPSTPTVEKDTDAPEGEDVMPPSLPTKPRVDFQERRRRVAKLSQFFGVNHAEIASSLVFAQPDDHPPILVNDERPKPVSGPSAEPIEVGVKVISRRRWGLGEDMRDVELSDAINKLRCLKAN